MDTLLEQVPFREDGTLDLKEMARLDLERIINAIMDEQASELCGEGNRRNGYRERKLMTVVGEVTLRIPKLREGTYFPDELIRPYSRVDRALISVVKEVYVMGLSTRKIERAAAELEFGKLSPSQISRMISELDEEIDIFQAAELDDMGYPYLWIDATYLDCRDEGRVQSKAVVSAIACGEDGKRRYIGFDCFDTESYSDWRGFLLGLRRRGLRGVVCVVSDAHAGLRRAIKEVLQGSSWQRCIVHLERDIAEKLPKRNDKARALAALKEVFAERDPEMVRALYRRACEEVGKLSRRAGELLEDAEADALAYLDFPYMHHVRLRTNNVQERANVEIKRRSKVINVFPSVKSMMRLVGSVILDVNELWMGEGYMDASHLKKAARRECPCLVSDEAMERASILMRTAMEALRKVA